MKIGILQCNTSRAPFAYQYGQYPDMVKHLLTKVEPHFTFEIYDVEHSQFPSHVNDCDAYLITGSKHSVNDPWPWIAELQQFIMALHQEKIKLIGICFGHQLIAKTFGGKVSHSSHGWGVGMSTNRVLHHKPWMIPACEEFNLLISHQEQVVELPAHAEVLASNTLCPFYMIQMNNSLTIQGHPEFSKDYAKALMTYREEILGKACYEKGLKSLNLEDDKIIIAQWITQFLNDF